MPPRAVTRSPWPDGPIGPEFQSPDGWAYLSYRRHRCDCVAAGRRGGLSCLDPMEVPGKGLMILAVDLPVRPRLWQPLQHHGRDR